MGICFSTIHPQCFRCEKSLDKKGPNVLYSFQGCGKYHNIIMCNLCLKEKIGYDFDDSYDFSTGNNDQKPFPFEKFPD